MVQFSKCCIEDDQLAKNRVNAWKKEGQKTNSCAASENSFGFESENQDQTDDSVTEYDLKVGGRVLTRNEQLTLRVGALPHGWTKRFDKVDAFVDAFVQALIYPPLGNWSSLFQERCLESKS